MSTPQDLQELTDTLDHEILMHRDVHFGGLFHVMYDYYKKGGKGVNPEFSLERLSYLETLEKKMKQNLSALLLTGSEAERVAKERQTYKKLREIYEVKSTKSPYPRLIADLILSEEEEPLTEINAIVKKEGEIVRHLVELVRNDSFRDPLSPGYGFGPTLAATCLGKIGDKRAIIALFESIGNQDFDSEDTLLQALKQIGKPAKEFLLKVVQSRPLNTDNMHAAIALNEFRDDEKVARVCFEMLREKEVLRDVSLATYLVLVCEGLKDEGLRREFGELAGGAVGSLKRDMEMIVGGWG